MMKVAIPLADGRLCRHFGHCQQFAVMEMDNNGNVVRREDMTPPPHEPGVLPAWLNNEGVTHVIAGGMGQRAVSLLQSNGITVSVGAPSDEPENLAKACYEGTLVSGNNACSH